MNEQKCAYCHMAQADWAGTEGKGFKKGSEMYCCQGCAEGLRTCTTDKIGTCSRVEMEQKKKS